jgi:hypothetical protein
MWSLHKAVTSCIKDRFLWEYYCGFWMFIHIEMCINTISRISIHPPTPQEADLWAASYKRKEGKEPGTISCPVLKFLMLVFENWHSTFLYLILCPKKEKKQKRSGKKTTEEKKNIVNTSEGPFLSSYLLSCCTKLVIHPPSHWPALFFFLA